MAKERATTPTLAEPAAALTQAPLPLESSAPLPTTFSSADVAASPPTNTAEKPHATAEAPSFDPALANLDPSDDEVVGPPKAIADCESRLHAAGVQFRVAQLPIVQKAGYVCGAEQVVVYLAGPGQIRFYPQPIVTCQLALALAHFEQVAQRTALEALGARLTSLTQGGTYNCRKMARFGLVSEHSYANAIDIRAFGLSDARTLSVEKYFGRPGDTAKSPEARFLRTLAQRLFDEDVFSVVVTRYFDELHRDHIHVDMAHYRTDGSR